MPAPHEVHAAPLVVFYAPVATAFPELLVTPPGPWVKLGQNGDLNYMDDGIKITHPLTTKPFRGLGDPGTLKEFIDTEDLMIELTVADWRLEVYGQALNQNSVTTEPAGAGTAGYRKMGLSRGIILSEFALLVRGTRASAYGDDYVAQYEIPRVVQLGEPNPVSRRSDPFGLLFKFKALVDPNAASADERFGRLLQQDADAGT